MKVSTLASTAAGAVEQNNQQQQQPVPMQTSSPPPLQQHSQQQAGIYAEPYLPPNVPPATASAYMPWPLMRPSAEPHQLPNQTACPTVPWPYMVPSAQPYGVSNHPAAHAAAAYPVAPTCGYYAPAMPVMMMPGGWPAAAAPMPGWQPVQLGGQQPPVAQGPPLAPAAPAAAAAAAAACRQPRRQAVSTKARVIVQVADKGDQDDDGGCTSDDDWLPEQMPAATAGSQQVVRVVYKVRVLLC